MNFWAVIPARYGSTRFPGKPLIPIAGVPLLQRVVEQIKKVKGLKKILVATDHDEILDLCEKNQVEAVKTDSDLASGTDRIYSAVLKNENSVSIEDVIINIQGDEPLIPPEWVEQMIEIFKKNPSMQILTLAHPLNMEELENLNSVKVVLDNQDRALYFSRFPIPHSREKMAQPLSLKHVGIYGYRWGALEKFCKAQVNELEKAESLEQLRAMYLGIPIHVMKVASATQGVDIPEDVQKVEKILAERFKTGGDRR